MQRAIDAFNAHLSEFIEESVERVIAARIPLYQGMSREQLEAAITRAFQALQQDLLEGTASSFPGLLAALGKARVDHPMSLSDMLAGASFGFVVVSERFDRLFADDLEPKLWWERVRNRVSYAGALKLWEAVLASREETIRRQHDELQRIALPIVPLHRGVLLLPLVGAIDARRAEHATAAALEAIATRRASVVILDVTGMPTVDAEVGSYFVRAAQAIRLLGAEPILVGINPEMAQAIVALDIDLRGLTLLSTLEDGIAYALDLQGKAIVERGRRALTSAR